MPKLSPLSFCLISTIYIQTAAADHSDYVDEIVVRGALVQLDKSTTISTKDHSATDSAKLLPTIPGANVNSNGAITGVAQYRGLHGDRVNIHMDQSPVLTGGPNAMDSPLSYTPPLLLENIIVSRGIVSVASGQETLGGHITANLNRGEFSHSDDFSFSGGLFTRYNSGSDGVNHALVSQFTNRSHKFSLLAGYDEGDDTETGNSNEIGGSEYQRERYDLSYGYRYGDTELELFVGRLDTEDTGTPALPMDILYIESDLAGMNISTQINDITVDAYVAYGHVDHGMTNYEMRNPASPTQFRATYAIGRNWAYGAKATIPTNQGELKLGFDANETLHDANISNPNSGMFLIENFNQSERNSYGLFAQWQTDLGAWQLESGIRYNLIDMDSDATSVSGMMGMMAMNAVTLQNRFNNADREEQYGNVDLVFKLSKPLSDNLIGHIGAARKSRAPSYQERFLWLPLASAGGLADGRNYIGNLDLDSETSYELNIGFAWQTESAYFTPEFFYRDIKDYIQGTPSNDMVANMLSTMMSGSSALQFNNIDAEMYGFDAAWGYRLNEQWRLDGVLSYVRGKRSDAGDDLYRVAPLNHRLALSYEREQFGLQIESVIYAKQSDVSAFNNEEETAGYGLVNLDANYQLSQNIEIGVGIENIFDKSYRDHLAGYNRNNTSDIPVGERLYGAGRNLFVEAKLTW
ncbi:MAG: TonB-dependent receptor [Pseudomonadales bacterium]|nr:TonB-dependent receptor [Pseudomonadales bacterium]